MDNITNAAVLEYQRIRIDALEKKVKENADLEQIFINLQYCIKEYDFRESTKDEFITRIIDIIDTK
tara:strand:+ start:287 stop:484 length:198 start_codon:yes stop_codon:yes gene_type:complete